MCFIKICQYWIKYFFPFSLKQYVAKYSNCNNREEGSFRGQKVLSILSSPEKDRDTGITLGAPAKNKEGKV